MNQNPNKLRAAQLDKMLTASGWIVQSKKSQNRQAGLGVAMREYQTDVGPADYVLFVAGKPVGIIEAKKADEAHHVTIREDQTEGYAKAKLKFLNNEPCASSRKARDIVNPSSIRTVVQNIKYNLPAMFPYR